MTTKNRSEKCLLCNGSGELFESEHQTIVEQLKDFITELSSTKPLLFQPAEIYLKQSGYLEQSPESSICPLCLGFGFIGGGMSLDNEKQLVVMNLLRMITNIVYSDKCLSLDTEVCEKINDCVYKISEMILLGDVTKKDADF